MAGIAGGLDTPVASAGTVAALVAGNTGTGVAGRILSPPLGIKQSKVTR